MTEYQDGDTVQSGAVLCDWSIRIWYLRDADGPRYDWIIDDGRGGYDESDMLYESVSEAMESLGVR